MISLQLRRYAATAYQRSKKRRETPMSVIFDSEKKIFKLDTAGSSYIFGINQDGILKSEAKRS